MGLDLSIQRQMRTDRPVPSTMRCPSKTGDLLWEIFQDNFDMSEIVPIGEALELIGTQAPILSSLSDVYAVWGATSAGQDFSPASYPGKFGLRQGWLPLLTLPYSQGIDAHAFSDFPCAATGISS